jgi:RHS repeat-associated protein
LNAKSSYYIGFAKDFGRKISDYRFGFNGMEKENEIMGDGNNYDYGARIYNSRLGKWLSVDPLQNIYPFLSPYCYVANSPISLTDPDGKRIIIYWKKNFWGKPVMHIQISGVIINSTMKAMPDFEIRNANLKVQESLEEHYNKNYGSFKVKVDYQMRVGTSNDVNSDDHVIHLVGSGILNNKEGGYTNALGGKIMWLDYNYFWSPIFPTIAHEFGHWLGLMHPKDYSPKQIIC